MNDQIRRNMPLFSIGVVKQLTELSARQIRYYEEHHLIHPARTNGKQRLFSFSDVDRLLEIKSLIEQGINISGIKQILAIKENDNTKVDAIARSEKKAREISNKELREYLRTELLMAGRQGKASTIQGELSRFYH